MRRIFAILLAFLLCASGRAFAIGGGSNTASSNTPTIIPCSDPATGPAQLYFSNPILGLCSLATVSFTTTGQVPVWNNTTGTFVPTTITSTPPAGSNGNIQTKNGSGLAAYGGTTDCSSTQKVLTHLDASGNGACTALALSYLPSMACGDLSNAAYSCSNDLSDMGNVRAGALASVHGGSGLASPTAHSLLMSEGASAFSLLTATTAGDLIIDQGSGSDFLEKAVTGDLAITSAGVSTVNTVLGGSTPLTTASWASPGTIGSGTPNTGKFTSLTATGTIVAGSGPTTITNGSGTLKAASLDSGNWNSPGDIGDVSPSAGTFTNINAADALGLIAAGGTASCVMTGVSYCTMTVQNGADVTVALPTGMANGVIYHLIIISQSKAQLDFATGWQKFDSASNTLIAAPSISSGPTATVTVIQFMKAGTSSTNADITNIGVPTGASFNTASAPTAFGTNITSTTLVASVSQNEVITIASWVEVSTIGTGCSGGAPSAQVTYTFTSPDGGSHTANGTSLTFAGNGALTTGGSSNTLMGVEVGTAITYTVASAAASGCTTAPQYTYYFTGNRS